MANREFFNFNHRITFQKEVQTSGEFGEIVSSWADVKTVWAKIEPSGYNQNTSRMKTDVEVSYTIIVRFDEELKGCKRILFGERVFWRARVQGFKRHVLERGPRTADIFCQRT